MTERYRPFFKEIEKKFGERIFKVTVNGGFTCPNVDGTKSKGGCTFCQESSYTGLTFQKGDSIRNQILAGMEYVRKRHKTASFFVYFQNGTNTYAPINRLKEIYETPFLFDRIKGVMIATRPDCLEKEVLDYLGELNERTYLWVELGLQSHRNDVLKKINRAHTAEDFAKTAEALAGRKIRTSAHIILGLPGEQPEDSRAKALFLNELPISAVKIHNLVVFKNTVLEKQFHQGFYQPLTLEDFTNQCIDFLEHLRPDILIQRINAHGPRDQTVAPEWSINKWSAINSIHSEMDKRDSWQGKKFIPEKNAPAHHDGSSRLQNQDPKVFADIPEQREQRRGIPAPAGDRHPESETRIFRKK